MVNFRKTIFLLRCYCSFVILCVHFSFINIFHEKFSQERKTSKDPRRRRQNSRASTMLTAKRVTHKKKLTLIPVFVCVCDEETLKKNSQIFL